MPLTQEQARMLQDAFTQQASLVAQEYENAMSTDDPQTLNESLSNSPMFSKGSPKIFYSALSERAMTNRRPGGTFWTPEQTTSPNEFFSAKSFTPEERS